MAYNGVLVADQLTFIGTVQDRAMVTALSTERCDRQKAERAVAAAYRAAGHEPPSVTIWMDSPIGGVLASGLGGQLWDQFRGQLNTHWLHDYDRRVQWARVNRGLVVGYIQIPKDSAAYLIHTEEHGANGIGPGVYELRRKREMAEEIRMIAD